MKLVSEDLVEDHIFRAAKEILFHLRIGLFELGDQIFGLEALGTYISGLSAQVVFFRKFAGALQEFQAVVIAPCLNVVFPDQVQSIPMRIVSITSS